MSFIHWAKEKKGDDTLSEVESVRSQAMSLGSYGTEVGAMGFSGLMGIVEALKRLASQDQQAYFTIVNKIKAELAQLGVMTGDQSTQDLAKGLRTGGVRFAQGAKQATPAPTGKPQPSPSNGMPSP